jgi:hypothetical protein
LSSNRYGSTGWSRRPEAGVAYLGVAIDGDGQSRDIGRPPFGPLAEAAALWRSAKAAMATGRRPWAAMCAALLSLSAATAYLWPSSRHAVRVAGGVRADLPWWEELVRLPGSAFLPTSDLPLAGAVAQLLIVVGLAELVVGRRHAVVAAAGGQVASSLAARAMIIAHAVTVVGLPASQAGVLDTGPSGITTAAGGWLLARTRSYWCLSALSIAMVCAAVLQQNLDGREHLIALVCGIAAATAPRTRTRLRTVFATHRLDSNRA